MFRRVRYFLLEPVASTISSAIFIRLMGVIYLMAMFPFIFQYQGIMGKYGVQPATWLLEQAWSNEGWIALFHFPSLYWIWDSDEMLLALILINCLAAVCLIINFRPFAAASTAWISFLSFTTIGGDFTIIIIDLFLAEVGFLTVLLTFAINRFGYTPRIIHFLFLLLLFRMWFSMGMVKFYFPGESWKELTFFEYFFPYQPMPNPISWYVHKLPRWTYTIAIVLTFIIEIVFPFFIFLGKKWRMLAVSGFTVFSIMIWLTGNYGYFNPLTIIIGIFLFYDHDYPGKITDRFPPVAFINNSTGNYGIYSISITLVVMHIIYIGLLFSPRLHNPQNHLNYFCYFENTRNVNGWKQVFWAPFRLISNLRLVNPYGVFKDISRFRVELRFEGSTDGITWQPYEFKYVPSGHTQILKFFAPYYPRLDHLMFYESYGVGVYNDNPANPRNSPQNPLNPYYTTSNPWICKFLDALKNNNPHIVGLLSQNPYEETSPEYIRVKAFLLNFTSKHEKKQSGRWWNEEYLFTPYDSSVETDKNCQPLYDLNEILTVVQENYR